MMRRVTCGVCGRILRCRLEVKVLFHRCEPPRIRGPRRVVDLGDGAPPTHDERITEMFAALSAAAGEEAQLRTVEQ